MYRHALIVGFVLLSSTGYGRDPNQFDPLLDRQPAPNPDRYQLANSLDTGFTVSSATGVYIGQVNSYLTPEESRLLRGTRPSLSFGVGYRLNGPVELAMDVSLGLGKTFDANHLEGKTAFDIFLAPRVFVHWYEDWPVSIYSGLGGLLGLFDLETEGVSQAGIGPTVLIGTALRSDRSFAIYLETNASYFYDFLAYTTNDGDADGSAQEIAKKERGKWFTVIHINIGIRLTNF